MDIVRLGEYNNVNPDYLPDQIVEGFTSKIWTERYLDPGQFEFKTPFVDELMEILPEQTFISHRHTKEVMQVETHSISTDDFGVEELTISGRSVDAIFQSRFVEGSYGKRRQMARQYAPGGAAIVMMWNSVNNDRTPDPKDVTRWRKDDDDLPEHDYDHDGPPWDWNTKDKLPNVEISDSATSTTGTMRRWWLKEGMLYDQLVRVLRQGHLGVRTIRPPSAVTADEGAPDGFVGERCWVKSTPLDEFGDIVRVTKDNYTELRFDIYRGIDRSTGQSENPTVIFNLRRDHFDKAEHLYSRAEWKTHMEVMSGLNRRWDIYRSGQSGFTGWQRRTMAMDAGEPEIPEEPREPKRKNYESDAAYNTAHNNWENKHDRWLTRRNRNIDEFEEDYKEDGLKELNDFKRVFLFSGETSDEANDRFVYKTDYNLGDKVTLRGRNGITETARVTEFVLTEDATGQRGYPGLEIVEE